MIDFTSSQHLHFKSLGSTNTEAKKIIDREKTPFIVTADYQINGRGRLGKQWHSIAGGVYFSLTIDTKSYTFQPHHYPFLTSLSVFTLLNKYISSGLHLKWPNDVLVNSKKIAGILLEQSNSLLIIGIGINVNQDPSQVDSIKETISMAKICNQVFDVKEIVVELKKQLSSVFTLYTLNPQQIFIDAKNKYLTLNQELSCKVGDRIITGLFIDLGETGELLLETANGIEKIYAAELIE